MELGNRELGTRKGQRGDRGAKVLIENKDWNRLIKNLFQLKTIKRN